MQHSRKLVTFDWAMKKILRHKANFGILEGLLSELLRRDVKIKEILEGESNQEKEKDKFNRVDVLAKLDGEELVIIEVQNTWEGDYFQRMLYGVSKSISEHIALGEAYQKVKKVISVNIVYFDLGQGGDYVYHGSTEFRGLHRPTDILGLSEKQRLSFGMDTVAEIFPEYWVIQVEEFNDITKDGLDEWIYFFKHAAIKKGFKAKGLAEANEKLEVMRLPEKDQRAYKRYLESLMDDASFAFTVKMEIDAGIAATLEPAIEAAVEVAVEVANAKKDKERQAALEAKEMEKQAALLEKEREILAGNVKRLADKGKSIEDIADILDITLETVDRMLGHP
jgi:hypothetical protein